MTIKLVKTMLVILLILGLSSCDWLTELLGANDPPVADAGPDQTVIVGAVVTLDGTGSSDPNDDDLTYLWTIEGVPAGASTPGINNSSNIVANFAPDTIGDYIVQLRVEDAYDEKTDQVTITVAQDISALVPAVPVSFSASLGNEDSIISWTEVVGETYNLYWSTTPGVTVLSSKLSAISSPHTHDPDMVGSTIYYALEATNSFGSSGLTGEQDVELSATPPPLSGTFVQATNLNGGRPVAMAYRGAVMVAAYEGGFVYISEDNGSTWQMLGTRRNREIATVALDDTWVFIGFSQPNVNDKQLLRYNYVTSGGWQVLDNYTGVGGHGPTRMRVDEINNNLYISFYGNSGADESLYRLNIGTAAVTNVSPYSSASIGSGIRDFDIGGDDTTTYLYVAVGGNVTEEFFYGDITLVSQGTNWTALDTGLEFKPWSITFFRSSQYIRIYAGHTEDSGSSRIARLVLRDAPGFISFPASWDAYSDSSDFTEQVFTSGPISLHQDNTYIAASFSNGGVYRKHGYLTSQSWSNSGTGLPSSSPQQTEVGIAADGTYWVGSKYGLYFNTTPGSDNWYRNESGPTASNVLYMTYRGGLFYAGTKDGLYRKDGSIWTLLGGAPPSEIYAYINVDDVFYRGTRTNGVQYFQIGDSTWSDVPGSPGVVEAFTYGNGLIWMSGDLNIFTIDPVTKNVADTGDYLGILGKLRFDAGFIYAIEVEDHYLKRYEVATGASQTINSSATADVMVYNGNIYVIERVALTANQVKRRPVSLASAWTAITTGAPADITGATLHTNGTTLFVGYSDDYIYATPLDTPGLLNQYSDVKLALGPGQLSNYTFTKNPIHIRKGKFNVGTSFAGLWTAQ